LGKQRKYLTDGIGIAFEQQFAMVNAAAGEAGFAFLQDYQTIPEITVFKLFAVKLNLLTGKGFVFKSNAVVRHRGLAFSHCWDTRSE
jgi:hypothetical protein